MTPHVPRPLFATVSQGWRTVIKPAEGKEDAEVGDFEWRTYGQCQEMIECLGSALTTENLVPARGAEAVRTSLAVHLLHYLHFMRHDRV